MHDGALRARREMVRGDELGTLSALYEAVRSGREPRLVALVGPAGCGAAEIAERFVAEARPPAVLRGVGARHRAFGTFLHAVGSAEVGEVPGADAVVDLRAYAEQRVRFFAEVRELIARLGAAAPPVVVIEDLDRADRGSLELLEFLLDARAVGAAPPPALFVATAESLDRAELATLRGAGATLVLGLEALDDEGVRAYLSRDDVVARVRARTGGLPGHIDDLLAGRSPSAPSAARELGAGARALLDAAAILDRPATVDELAAVAEVAPRRVDAEALVEAGLVHRTVRDGVLTLRIRERARREELYASLDRARRSALHRGAAHLHAERWPEEAARHAVHGGEPEQAFALAMRASEALVAAHGPHEAAELLLEIADGAGEPPVEVSMRTAELLLAVGDFARAKPHARRARDARPDDPGAILLSARVLAGAGELTTARDEVRRALASVVDERLGAELALELAQIEYRRGDPLEARRLASAAAQRAADRGWLPAELEAEFVLAKIAVGRRELDDADRIASAAHERAERAGLGRQACQLVNILGAAAWYRGDLERARARFERAAELAVELGAVLFEAVALENVATIDQVEERFGVAAAGYRRAHDLLVRTGHQEKVGRVLFNLASLRTELGDAAGALGICRRARDHVSEAAVEWLGLDVAGWAHLQLGSHDAAEAAFAAAARLGESLGARRIVAEATLGLAYAARDSGREGLAREHLAAVGASDLGRRDEARRMLLRATLAEGAERLQLARQAVQIAQAARSAALEQRGRLQLAEALAAAGAPSHAVQELRAALELEERLLSDVALEDRAVFAARPDALARIALAAHLDLPPGSGSPRRAHEPRPALGAIVGASSVMQELRARIERLGPSDRIVLVHGESGVGKELVADALHATSPRRDRAIVKVNCAALTETLLLSELFGHERGAFTGAHATRKGRFELADGGTLFLDEIGEISLRTQAALLRVLQERTFERVGGTRTLKVDVRIVAATNRDLRALVRERVFREDLFYRLAGLTVRVPPLRERLDDLPALVASVLTKLAVESGRAVRLGNDALGMLRRHRWPGNVRELENVLRSASVMSETALLCAADLAPFVDHGGGSQGPEPVELPDLFYGAMRGGGISIYDLRRDVERRCLERALEETGGNITAAAELLGMKRPRVSQLVKELGLKREEDQ